MLESLAQILQRDERIELGLGASVDVIRQAERELDVVFPEDYKEFLVLFGRAWLDTESLYGLGEGLSDSVDVVTMTKGYRDWESSAVLVTDVCIMSLGNGDEWVLDTAEMSGGRCPVYLFHHELEERSRVADSFEEWLSATLHSDDFTPPMDPKQE